MNLKPWHKVTAVLLNLAIVIFLVYEIFKTPIYSEGDLNSARSYAVSLAKEGDIEKSLQRLQALIDYAPDNKKLRYDYITVLIWADKKDEALAELSTLDLTHAPVWFLTETLPLAQAEGDIVLINKLYAHLPFNSPERVVWGLRIANGYQQQGQQKQAELLVRDLYNRAPTDPKILEKMALYETPLPQRNHITVTEAKPVISTEPPQPVIENKKIKTPKPTWLEETMQQARKGQVLDAVKRLENARENGNYSSEVSWNLLVLYNWSGKHKKAVQLGAQLPSNKVPNWVFIP